MRSADIQNKDTLHFRHFDDFESIRCYKFPGSSRGFAAGMGLEPQRLRMSLVDHGTSPVLQRYIFNINPGIQGRARFIAFRIDHQPAVTLPDALFSRSGRQIDVSIGQPRWRSCGRRRRTALALSGTASTDLTLSKSRRRAQHHTHQDQPISHFHLPEKSQYTAASLDKPWIEGNSIRLVRSIRGLFLS